MLEAEDGETALRLLEQNEGRIRLVITDVVMPRMSGQELGHRVSLQHANIKVLFTSGYIDGKRVRTLPPGPPRRIYSCLRFRTALFTLDGAEVETVKTDDATLTHLIAHPEFVYMGIRF